MKLSEREQRVLDCIPSGHRNAVRRRDLALLTGMGDREVREIIYDLVVRRELPIGSSTDRTGGGYFLIQDKEDLEVATRHLLPRAKAIYRRSKALEKIAQERFNHQLRLVSGE